MLKVIKSEFKIFGKMNSVITNRKAILTNRNYCHKNR